jgi:hypothetical protein
MDHLHELWGSLVKVANDFAAIPAVDKSLHDAVGHADLANVVMSFGNGWDARREKIAAALDVMWRAAETVHGDFKKVDAELAKVLTQEGD